MAEAYWPGFALLLTPFTWASVPWLCNPVISALTLLVIHRLALEMFDDREAAGFALLLTIASPVIFANGISYYSMPAHLLANSVYALLLVRPTPLRAAAAGVVGSLALALHNPVPHMLFAAPWLVWVATRRGGMRLFASLIAGYLPLCVLLGLGWFLFSGHLLREGLVSAAGPAAPLHRLQHMIEIFSLPECDGGACTPHRDRQDMGVGRPGTDDSCRRRRSTVAPGHVVPVVHRFGAPDALWIFPRAGRPRARLGLPVLPLCLDGLAAAGDGCSVPSRANTTATASSHPRLFEDGETKNFVATCVLLTLVFGVGFRAWQVEAFMARDVSQVPQYTGTERRVVILDGRHSFYGADLVQNDPWLRRNEIRMYSHGAAADEQMMAQYYPELHRVYADRYGTVWSRASRVATTLSTNDPR